MPNNYSDPIGILSQIITDYVNDNDHGEQCHNCSGLKSCTKNSVKCKFREQLEELIFSIGGARGPAGAAGAQGSRGPAGPSNFDEMVLTSTSVTTLHVTSPGTGTIIVQQWGGGGAGSLIAVIGGTTYGGSGGGAGAYATYSVQVSNSDVVTFSVAGVSDAETGEGNNTTFATTSLPVVTTLGGQFGGDTFPVGGAGGGLPVVPAGGIGIPGGQGGNSMPSFLIDTAGDTDTVGAKGGDTFAGSGGPGGEFNQAISASNGNQPGGGGGGDSGLSGSGFGGSGAAGLIILTLSNVTLTP
ncbi:MAG: hypothetical protein Hyperionvirus6_25 [Hyperionvirus sp.]|uniref:Uncharacterized protein n=1 Tax=Hyperionvirus sp. TaxID=2487770 RepID=A0A3G5AA26_9VIRU|nr:MAG: hypothetical protein Hyperionvirus6_25 [Hyperionvirus sp.]